MHQNFNTLARKTCAGRSSKHNVFDDRNAMSMHKYVKTAGNDVLFTYLMATTLKCCVCALCIITHVLTLIFLLEMWAKFVSERSM